MAFTVVVSIDNTEKRKGNITSPVYDLDNFV
jgi:hypothetical protein